MPSTTVFYGDLARGLPLIDMSSLNHPTIIICLIPTTFPISKRNHSLSIPTPVQPESKKPSPTPDKSHSAVSGNPDETRQASTPELEPEAKPGPEPEAEIEIDPNMQPPHRAEALDVLAGMEVRFAELRGRLYANKMKEAAREEAMILDGTHPELVFFQRELDARRSRRKQLAETRRTLEIGWCATMRCAEEFAAWSEWRHARDELQDNMRTECVQECRWLAREQRLAERLATVCPIPALPISLLQPPSLESLHVVWFLNFVQPFQSILSEVSLPERKIPFNHKTLWTAVTLLVFLVCSQVSLYSIMLSDLSDPPYWM
ncbi:Sds3-like protein [Rhizoctonia solani AG-3 Rhs1AP]|uniref:Sds3-like protein n=2 Tax=Rhizoctonia solani AG-3 TaxID=1086053 RepID=A0A074SDM5_9AGAM|nr:Sds3-like protein [Rhizoctonia solani AG-3 Rhs1AP]KEP48147.1 Sds3-like protein [Rhizoctonia solani 123E]